jgi:K+-sensing histidine kinase KdpD
LKSVHESLARLQDAARTLADARNRAESRAAASNQRLEEVLAVICHDLRAPLGAIFLSASLLERAQRAHHADEQIMKHLESIRSGAEQIDRFLEDLVEMRRVERGDLGLETNLNDVATLVDEAVARARPRLLVRRALKIRSSVAPGLPLVRVDRRRIVRVLGAFLEHFARTLPRSSAVEVAATGDGEGVTFSVEGPLTVPVSEEGLFRSPSALPGHGFTLSVAARIVEEHGGRVHAGACDGRLRLSFTLPAGTAEARAA